MEQLNAASGGRAAPMGGRGGERVPAGLVGPRPAPFTPRPAAPVADTSATAIYQPYVGAHQHAVVAPAPFPGRVLSADAAPYRPPRAASTAASPLQPARISAPHFGVYQHGVMAPAPIPGRVLSADAAPYHPPRAPSTAASPLEPARVSAPPPAPAPPTPTASTASIAKGLERKLTENALAPPAAAVVAAQPAAEEAPELDLAPVSKKGLAHPARPGAGTAGRKVMIRANHFVVNVADNNLFHYDVSINPESKSRQTNREVLSELIKVHGKTSLGGKLPAYDGRKSLYTAGSLPFQSEEFTVTLVDPEKKDKKRAEREYKIIIRIAGRTDLYHLQQFLCGRQRDMPQETIQVLDVVLRESPSWNYVTVSRSFFSTTFGHRGDIGEGLECWRGYYQSLRPTQMGLSLNIDISATSFFKPVTVIQFVQEFLNLRDVSRPLNDRDRVKIKKALRGVRVETNHQEDQIRRYKITGITAIPMSQLIFPIDERGTRMSVVQYFSQRYQYNLQHTNWPCLQSGSDARPVYLPMEACKIVEGQRYSKKLNDKQATNILRATCQRPQQREQSIREMVLHNKYAEDKIAQEFGIKVCNDLVSVPARVLPPPMLKYHDSGREKTCAPSVGQWNMIGKVSINPESKSRQTNREVLSELIKVHGKTSLGGKLPAYDGRKSLYTAGSLPFESEEFTVTLVDPEKKDKDRAEREYKIIIRIAGRTDLYHLQQFLCGRQRDMPQETIQVLDVVLRESPSWNYVTVSRSFFSTTFGHRGDIGEGLECWRGYYQSLRPTQMGLSLNIDISATSFFKPVTVIQFVQEFLNLCDVSRPLNDRDRVKIKKALRGVRVETNHQEDQIRRYKITGITAIPMSQLIFPIDERGTRMSVVQYFSQRYQYNLQHTNWPCLQSGSDARPVYLPMEACKIVEGQRYSKKLNDKQATNILRATCQRPQQREQSIREMVLHNKYAEDKFAQEFGIKVCNDLVSVPARVLPPPMLKYHDSGREKICAPSVGQWNMIGKTCKIVEGQRYSKKLNDKQVTNILRATCQRPQQREQSIHETVLHNKYAEDKFAQEFGIKVCNDLVSAPARVLPPPMLKYHDSGREKTCASSVGQWNMIGKVSRGKQNTFTADGPQDLINKICYTNTRVHSKDGGLSPAISEQSTDASKEKVQAIIKFFHDTIMVLTFDRNDSIEHVVNTVFKKLKISLEVSVRVNCRTAYLSDELSKFVAKSDRDCSVSISGYLLGGARTSLPEYLHSISTSMFDVVTIPPINRSPTIAPFFVSLDVEPSYILLLLFKLLHRDHSLPKAQCRARFDRNTLYYDPDTKELSFHQDVGTVDFSEPAYRNNLQDIASVVVQSFIYDYRLLLQNAPNIHVEPGPVWVWLKSWRLPLFLDYLLHDLLDFLPNEPINPIKVLKNYGYLSTHIGHLSPPARFNYTISQQSNYMVRYGEHYLEDLVGLRVPSGAPPPQFGVDLTNSPHIEIHDFSTQANLSPSFKRMLDKRRNPHWRDYEFKRVSGKWRCNKNYVTHAQSFCLRAVTSKQGEACGLLTFPGLTYNVRLRTRFPGATVDWNTGPEVRYSQPIEPRYHSALTTAINQRWLRNDFSEEEMLKINSQF